MNNNQNDQRFQYHEIFGKETNCDRTNSLHQYFEGTLPENQQKEFRKHLADCDSCAKLLAELQEAETAAHDTILDANQADKIFSQNRASFQEQLKEKYGVVTLPPKWNFRIPNYASAMLMVLIAVLIYPAYRSFVLDQQVTQLTEELNRERNNKPPQVIVEKSQDRKSV